MNTESSELIIHQSYGFLSVSFNIDSDFTSPFERLNTAMRQLFSAFACLFVFSPLQLAATPELALKIQETWKKANTQWQAESAKASTPEQRAKLLESRPNATAYASRMWGAIGPSLQETWTLEPAAWFMQISQGIKDPKKQTPLFASQIEKTKKAILTHHTSNSDIRLNSICYALTRLSDPLSLSILEKIESTNPNPKIQGVAALCAAMVIKGLGDDTELMRKRLIYIRKAIINSADVKVGQTTVALLAENELYQIRFLSKGRVAPEVTGMDSTARPFQLSQQKGKIVVLIFWSSTIPQAKHVMNFTNEMHAKFKDKPVLILGVNHDPVAKLRELRANGDVTWRNLSDPSNQLARAYRVGNWPMVYVLDHQQRIQYAGGLGSFVELTADALIAEIR